MRYYLLLGSNMGDRRLNLEKAIKFLETRGNILKTSSIYETSPVSMPTGTPDFLNQAICCECPEPPELLLRYIKEFERSLGRDTDTTRKINRPIDIDILAADRLVMETKELTLPHKEMVNRAFTLIPLNEIAPRFIHPILQKPVREILAGLDSTETVKKLG